MKKRTTAISYHLFALLAGDCQMGSHANGFFDCPPGLDGFDLVNKASPSSIVTAHPILVAA